MNSCGSSYSRMTGEGGEFMVECRKPKECEKCGEPLEVYMQFGGVSARWHLSPAAMTSAVSNLCGDCYRKSLEKGQEDAEA